MKNLPTLALILFLSSCVPVKVAPRFENKDYRVVKAKKFKRKLPNETSFIFKDPKPADEFYNYLNTKFQLNGSNVDSNVEIKIDDDVYYLSYIETEIVDKNLNLSAMAIDANRHKNGKAPRFEDKYITTTREHWYLILTVYDAHLKNCLLDQHPMKAKVLRYLKDLKQEYLTTYNYEELLFAEKF